MSPNNNPLVTVNILSFNRREELSFILTKVFDQDYKNIEVIVVDNASSDGTQEMLRKEFPNVRLIELKENVGIAGWNKGFEAAKGEYVLVLDDDSYPEIDTLEAGIQHFRTNDNIAVIGFTIFNSYYNLIENIEEYYSSNGRITEVLGFIGCGALIRRKVFIDLGGYEKLMFLYYNELEFSIRARNAGYSVLFDPNHRVIHTYSLTHRNEQKEIKLLVNERRFQHTFRSYFVYLIKNFDSISFIRYSSKLVLSKFYVAVKLGYFSKFVQTLLSLMPLMLKAKAKRNPVADNIQEEYNYGNLRFKELYVFYKR